MADPTPTTAVDRLPGRAVLLDVREDDEWAAGHAPDAVHVPLGDLPARLDEVLDAADRAAGGEVHVLCRAGGRAQRAAAWLNGNGVDAVVVEGGMGAWADAGRPMVADGPAEPQVL